MCAAPSSDTVEAPRGACPSVHQPFAERDGALVRVRVPGGLLHADQVRRVAAAARRGTIVELTNRANLQIRGVAPVDQDEVTARLVAAGVTSPDPGADGRRNVLAGPAAGCDPEEVIDTRSRVADVARRLSEVADGALSPKFGVVVDGGGAIHVRGRKHDIALGAVRDGGGRPAFEVRLGEALPVGHRSGPVALLAPEGIVEFVSAALAAVAADPAASGRMAALTEKTGAMHAIATFARNAGIELRVVAPEDLPPPHGPSLRPLGVLPAREAGKVMVGAMPVLGRLTADGLEAIGTLAAAAGGGEVRLTPWRSVLLPAVVQRDAEAVLGELGRLGLVVDVADPAGHVVACAGSQGCPSGLTEAQRDGGQLVELLRVAGMTGAASVHVSGCAKRCAAGDQEFALTLEGGPVEGMYALFRGDRPGAVERGLSRLQALDAAAAVVARAAGEGATVDVDRVTP